MTKPSKTKLIQIRDASYREQPVECCGTCRHFVPHYIETYSGPLRGRVYARCEAIELRGDTVRKDISYLGICDLYEPRQESVK